MGKEKRVKKRQKAYNSLSLKPFSSTLSTFSTLKTANANANAKAISTLSTTFLDANANANAKAS